MLLLELQKSKALGQITPELSALLLVETNEHVRACQHLNPVGSEPSLVGKGMADLHRVVLEFKPEHLVNTQQAKLWIRKILLNSFYGA